MSTEPTTYPGHRFPAEVIRRATWLYHVFGLSLRDVELILAERGVVVSHESIRRWCLRFGAAFAARLRRRRPRPGDTWHMDEVYLKINGELFYLWRAVDQHGVVLESWSKTAAMPRLPNASSNACWWASSTSPERSSRMGSAATASRNARSCPVCGIGPAAT